MFILTIIVFFCLFLSLVVDRSKTWQGIRKGLKMFLDILPTLLGVLALVSIFLYLLPEKTLSVTLGSESGLLGVLIAALIGSISLIPGFISYPLARIFLDRGVPVMTVAVFMTTLMMVGILTLPLEIKFFGKKAALMRNFLSFIGALIIGLLVGIFI